MNREAIIALKEKVEAGTIIGNEDGFACFDHGARIQIWPAMNGSLDAAKALHEAVLPGWAWEACVRPFGVRPHRCHFLLTTDHTGWGNGKTVTASSDNPARAWLIAILSALIAQEEESDGQG